MADERYALIAEWYDPQATIIRRYQLLYYASDGTVEMFDIKNRRVFLRRTTVDNVKLSDLFLGNTVNVLSRQLTFVEYGDDFTKRRLGCRTERTCALVKPAAFAKLGAILEAAQSAGLSVANLRMCTLDRAEALEFYREHEGKAFLPVLLASITAGPILALELMGADAVRAWRALIGPTDPARARQEAPSSLRARYGQDATNNAVHGSDSDASAARELGFFFPAAGPARANTSSVGSGDCTCALVKPHAVASGSLGQILSAVLDAGFAINAMAMFRLDKVNAEEFLEVYKGVVAEYNGMVVELTSGPCVAIEIGGGSGDVYKEFREFCGPADPEIARHLRPRTLRARFGKDKVQNAVHCTDLPEDTQLEVQYFFQILDK